MAHKTVRQREADIDDRLNNLGVCFLDLGSDAPPPDPAIGQAAQMNAEVGREYLDWYKQKDAADKPNRDAAIQLALDQAKTQTATAKKQNDMADETYAYTKGTFRPLEQKIATEALGYDTAARRDQEAAQAQADVGSAMDASKANLVREVESRGGDVNSGNFTASLANLGAKGAAAAAGAGNQARKNVEQIGAAKLADAANLGRGIASTNATQTALGLQAGNSSVNNAKTPLDISAQQIGQYGQAAGVAMQGNSSAGNLLLGQYNAQTNANAQAGQAGSALMGAVGTVAGGFLGGPGGAMAGKAIFSDKNMKNGVKPVKAEVSLAAVRKMPVKSWKYKEGSAADDGGQRHTGPMAQDARAALGDATAPGGKKIDLISMMGHTVNAVKALDKKVTLSLANAKRSSKA